MKYDSSKQKRAALIDVSKRIIITSRSRHITHSEELMVFMSSDKGAEASSNGGEGADGTVATPSVVPFCFS